MNRKFRVKSTQLKVGELRLHAAANRELRRGRVKYLIQHMDPDALGRFAVWRDGGNLYVIDGQHRKVALEEMGLPDWPVNCDVYDGMTFQDACEQFLNLNNSLTIVPFDKFDKGVKAGREKYVETKRIVEQAGPRIAGQAGDGKIVCVAALIDVYDLDRGVALERSLAWAIEAWGMTAQAVEGQLIRGLGLVAARYNGELDDSALVKKLAKHGGGPANIVGAAKSRRDLKGGTVGRNVAAIIVDLYNKGRRNGQLATL